MAEIRRAGIVGMVAAAVAAGIGFTVGLSNPPAGAQEPTTTVAGPEGTIAATIGADGWYADPAAVGDLDRLAAIAQESSSARHPMGFALLAAEPPGSSPAFAEVVLDELIRQGEPDIRTVVVLSPADVGVVSDVWDDAAIDRALDGSLADLRASPTDGIETLVEALSAEPTMSEGGVDGEEDDDASDDGGGLPSGMVILLLVVGGLVAVVSWARRLVSGDSYDENDGDWADDSYRSRSRWRSRRSQLSWGGGSRRRSSGSSRSRSSTRSGRGRGGRRL